MLAIFESHRDYLEDREKWEKKDFDELIDEKNFNFIKPRLMS